MRLSNIGVIYRKELLDALRDRRTIFSAIVIPLILFPLLIFGFSFMVANSVKKVQQESFNISIMGATNAPVLAEKIKTNSNLKIENSSTNFQELISNKKLRAALEIPESFESVLQNGNSNALKLVIYFYTGELRSQFAVRTLQQILREYSDSIVAERLKLKGMTPEVLKPFTATETNVAPAEKVGGNVLGGLIPYMIIFLSFAGAMAPAIDLTAGEKERGTIETILASPVSRIDLVFGKFLMVLTVSMITTLISLTSFGVTFSVPALMIQQIGGAGGAGLPFHLSLNALLVVFLLILPLAIMFSAGLMAIALFAKTYKEAQTYISPLLMIIIMPALAAMLPGFDIKPILTIVPILNVSLVCKEALSGNYQLMQMLAVFGSSCFYAAIALALAVVMFRRESVLFRT